MIRVRIKRVLKEFEKFTPPGASLRTVAIL
jgi:hypothetical protein